MSVRAGLLIVVVVLALAGVLYLFSDNGNELAGGAGFEKDRGDTPTVVADREDAELIDTAGVSLSAPGADKRSVIAPTEEQGEALALDESTEVDRATVAVLSGYVHDEQGRPVAGARILASRNALELMAADAFGAFAMMDEDLAERIQEASTDENGFFELVGISPGQPGLQITATGFVPQVKTDLLVATREHQELTDPIVLDASAVVTGVVLDPSGFPVGGAEVTTKKKKAGMMGMIAMAKKGVETAADGSFRLDMLELEELEIVVTHTSFAVGTIDVDTREGGAIEGLEVRLERGSSIRGRVTGMAEGVAETLQIVAFPADFNLMQGMRERTGDVAADGSFELWGVPEGSTWNVSAREDDGEELTMMSMWNDGGMVTNRVEANAGDGEVELEYRPSATISFQVVDAETGRPLTRLKVYGGAAMFFREPGFEDYPEGRVRLEGQRPNLGEDEIHVNVDAEGYQSRLEMADVSGGPQVDLGTLKLQPAVVAQFRVIDALTGAPVEGVEVSIAKERSHAHDHDHDHDQAAALGGVDPASYGARVEGESDAEGLVRIETSLDGRFLVLANAEGFGPLRMPDVELVGSDVTPITLELRQGATVRVSATDINGIPLPARKIEHRAPGAEGGSSWDDDGSDLVTDSDGVASFENLGAGAHRFRIAKLESTTGEPSMMMLMMAMERGAEDDDDSWATVEVSATGFEDLVLVELPTGSLTGRVTEAGKPLRRATLTLRKADAEEEEADEDMDAAEAALRSMGREMSGQGGPSAKSERDGSFAFESVEVGSYVLEIDHRKRAMRAEYEIMIVAGDQVQDFDLDLAILAGKVVDGDGDGVKGALVSVVPFVEPAAEEEDASAANTELARGLMSELLGVEGKVRTFKTRRDGSFELRGVTPDVRLVVQVDGSEAGYQNTTSEPLELGRNESREDLELVVQRGGSLEVTVLEADGTATEFVLVRLERSDGAMEPMNELAMGGVKKLTGLTPGTYRVIADDNPDEDALFGGGDATIGKVDTTIEVVGGETVTVELRLPD